MDITNISIQQSVTIKASVTLADGTAATSDDVESISYTVTNLRTLGDITIGSTESVALSPATYMHAADSDGNTLTYEIDGGNVFASPATLYRIRTNVTFSDDRRQVFFEGIQTEADGE